MGPGTWHNVRNRPGRLVRGLDLSSRSRGFFIEARRRSNLRPSRPDDGAIGITALRARGEIGQMPSLREIPGRPAKARPQCCGTGN